MRFVADKERAAYCPATPGANLPGRGAMPKGAGLVLITYALTAMRRIG